MMNRRNFLGGALATLALTTGLARSSVGIETLYGGPAFNEKTRRMTATEVLAMQNDWMRDAGAALAAKIDQDIMSMLAS